MLKSFDMNPLSSCKKYMVLLLTIILSLNGNSLYSQDEEGAATLFNFSFFVDKQIIDEYYKDISGDDYQSDYTTSIAFSEELKDSILKLTEEYLSQYLGMEVFSMKIGSIMEPGPGYFDNFPSVSFKKAKKEGPFYRYIKIGCRFDMEEKTATDIGYKKIKTTPKILISVTIYDNDKKVILKKNTTIKEHSAFASSYESEDTNTKKKSKPVSMNDIYILYEYALRKFLQIE